MVMREAETTTCSISVLSCAIALAIGIAAMRAAVEPPSMSFCKRLFMRVPSSCYGILFQAGEPTPAPGGLFDSYILYPRLLMKQVPWGTCALLCCLAGVDAAIGCAIAAKPAGIARMFPAISCQ